MTGTGFSVDILNPTTLGQLGAGPVLSVSRASRSIKLDQAGSFSVEASGVDASTAEVLAKRVARISGLLGTPASRIFTNLASGTVDKIDRRVNMSTGEVGFVFSGSDLVGELANTSCLNTALEATGSPITVAAAIALIAALVPAWTIDTTTYASSGTTTNTSTSVTGVVYPENFMIGGRIAGTGIPVGATVSNIVGSTITLSAAATASGTVALSGALIYLKCAGEAVLTILNKIATTVGHHFRQSGTGRTLVWLYKVQVSSGVRIISAGDGEALINNDEVALVKDSLEITSDTHDIVTRIYASGGGNSTARIFLNTATLTAPTGYTLHIDADKEKSYIEHDAAVALYGVIERQVSFKDSNPNDSTSTAAISTGNQVLTQAVEYLRLHSAPLVSYRFSLVKLDKAVYPGQTVQLTFRRTVDGYRAVDEDATLFVLDSTLEFRTDGDPRTVAMTVATTDRRPASSVGAMVATQQAQMSTDSHSFLVPRALVADVATGTGLTPASVPFIGVTGALAEDNANLAFDDTNNRLGVGTNAPAAKLDLDTLSTATTTQAVGLLMRHRSSNTPGVGFGGILRVQADTDNHTNANQFGITVTWVVATNGSQTARVQFFVYDTAAREGIRLEATGATVNMGLLGASGYGSGVKVIAIGNATTVPSTNPTGGGVLYVESGALKWRGSSGTVTILGPA